MSKKVIVGADFERALAPLKIAAESAPMPGAEVATSGTPSNAPEAK